MCFSATLQNPHLRLLPLSIPKRRLFTYRYSRHRSLLSFPLHPRKSLRPNRLGVSHPKSLPPLNPLPNALHTIPRRLLVITTAALIRNEKGKFLEEILLIWEEFSSRILILDNESTDGSGEVARKRGAEVLSVKGEMWGNESFYRKALFESARKRTPEGEWIFILDADMIPARNPLSLFEAAGDAIAFPLYDIWYVYDDGFLTYREDNFWQGHLHPRIWAVRNTPKHFLNTSWGKKGMHSGHFPLNMHLPTVTFAPKDFSLLHFAYSSDPLRYAKLSQYTSVSSHLSAFEKAHAQSIVDSNPRVKRLDFTNHYYLTPP